MGRQSKIRWSSSDEEKLRKTVRNFNDKIRRLERKNPGIKNALPEKVTVKEMKELISTRQDFNREINSLQRFSKKGASDIVDVPGSKYNLKTTRWQKNEMSRRVGTINRKREARYKYISEIQAKLRGKDLGYTVGDIGMRSTDERATEPMNAFFPTMRRVDLNKRLKHIRKESGDQYWFDKEQALRDNVIKGIDANYKAQFPEDVENIINAIKKMSFKKFYETFMGEPGEMEWVSPPPGGSGDDQMKLNIEILKSTWVPNYESPMAEEVSKAKTNLLEKIKNKKKEKR